jgi:hypothetical protein
VPAALAWAIPKKFPLVKGGWRPLADGRGGYPECRGDIPLALLRRPPFEGKKYLHPFFSTSAADNVSMETFYIFSFCPIKNVNTFNPTNRHLVA